VLEEYEGTILLVSHDRYLVSHLATEVWEVRDGYLTTYAGSYAEFVAVGQKGRVA